MDIVESFSNYLISIGQKPDTYSNSILSWLEFHPNYEEVEFDNINKFIVHLKSLGNEAETINKKLKAIRSFYKFLFARGDIEEDILQTIYKFKLHKVTRKEKDKITEEELQEMIKWMGIVVHYQPLVKIDAVLHFLLFTGLRKAEFLKLKRADIFLDGDKGDGIPYVKVRGETKTKSERTVYMPKRIADKVRNYFGSEPEEYHAFNLTPGQFTRLMTDFTAGSPKGKRITAHSLRHSLGNILHRGNLGIKDAQIIYGHKNITTTELYYKPTQEDVKKNYFKNIK